MTKKKSFSQQYADLEKITEWFEAEDVDLEEALKKFEEGLGLVKDLKSHLNNIENKVTDIKKQFKDVLE